MSNSPSLQSPLRTAGSPNHSNAHSPSGSPIVSRLLFASLFSSCFAQLRAAYDATRRSTSTRVSRLSSLRSTQAAFESTWCGDTFDRSCLRYAHGVRCGAQNPQLELAGAHFLWLKNNISGRICDVRCSPLSKCGGPQTRRPSGIPQAVHQLAR